VTEILQHNDVILFDFGWHYTHFHTKPKTVTDFARDMTQFLSTLDSTHSEPMTIAEPMKKRTVETLAPSNLAGGHEFFVNAGKTKCRVPDGGEVACQHFNAVIISGEAVGEKEHTTVEVLALSNLAGGCEFLCQRRQNEVLREEWWWVKPSMQRFYRELTGTQCLRVAIIPRTHSIPLAHPCRQY
jgi:hypothetical protein